MHYECIGDDANETTTPSPPPTIPATTMLNVSNVFALFLPSIAFPWTTDMHKGKHTHSSKACVPCRCLGFFVEISGNCYGMRALMSVAGKNVAGGGGRRRLHPNNKYAANFTFCASINKMQTPQAIGAQSTRCVPICSGSSII